MKKLIIIILIVVLGALLWFVGLPLYEQHSANKTQADLRSYLGIFSAEDAAVMIGETHSSSNAIVRSGVVYWEAGSVKNHLSDCFWTNTDDGILLLTTADEVVRARDGERFYTRHAEAAPGEGMAPEDVQTDMPVFFVERGRGYVSLDYAKQFSNFTYELFENPYRVQIYANEQTHSAETVLKRTNMRTSPGIKSEIVRGLARGETVYTLNSMNEWCKVLTRDALVGWVETRRLSGSEGRTDEVLVVETPQDYAEPEYTALTEEKRLCIGWHQVSVADANAYLSDAIEGAWPLDVISPTWYSVADASGAVTSLAWRSYVDEAHARGLEVWPLVNDFTDGLDRTSFLESAESRNAFVSYLMSQARELGFDGINLDFEVVPLEAASGFEQLVRELSVACRAHGLVYSIDNYPPRAHTEHYNRALQGKLADYVIIMGYDEHWGTSSGTGSVASLPFVRDAIDRTLSAPVPANKVINAAPFYTRVWATNHADGSVSIALTPGHEGQAKWVEDRELEPIWSEELGQYYTQIDSDGKTYQVWLEDEASMQARIEVMADRGLGGIACWRLGLEDDSIWDVIGAYTRG